MLRGIVCAAAFISLIFSTSRQTEGAHTAAEEFHLGDAGRRSAVSVFSENWSQALLSARGGLQRLGIMVSGVADEFRENHTLAPRRFRARGTAYYPHNSRLQGGYHDRRGRPLRTLQAYLKGRARYVSVAMDTHVFPYGTRLRIRELEEKYGGPIEFRVVDTGGAFCPNPLDPAHLCRGEGTERIDICVKSKGYSFDRIINGVLTLVVEGANRRASVAKIPDNKGML